MADNDDLPAEEPNILPSKGEKSKLTRYARNKTQPREESLLPSAEAYEAQGNNLELLIRDLKGELKREFQDELVRIQFTLAKKDQEIAKLKFELEQQKALVAQQREIITRQSQRASGKEEPINYKNEKERTISELQEEIAEEEAYLSGARERQDQTQFTRKGPAHNPTGKGGLPDREGASGISINSSAYIGDKIKLGKESGEELNWNPEEGKYNLAQSGDGLQYTFFSAEMAYLNKDYNCQQSQAYSQNIFKKQVWYKDTPKGRFDDGIGAKYAGKVPLSYFLAELAERLNPVLFLPSGGIIEKQDFRKAFANWRYKYQVGKFYKTRSGELYSINEVDESRSQGNPPAYRTAGRDNPAKGIISGERVKTSNEERKQWLRNKKL